MRSRTAPELGLCSYRCSRQVAFHRDLSRLMQNRRTAPRNTHMLLRRIFAPRGLDALQNRKSEKYNRTHCDPMRGEM